MVGAIAVGLLVAGVWVRHRWLVVTYRIAGGSMAETLVGDHVHLKCTDCGFSFRCGSTEVPRDNVLNCPNCGQPHEIDDQTAVRRGHAAEVDRWPVIVGGPRRWDLVAIAQPGSPGEFAVKRVVGLPGELVTIADGRVSIVPASVRDGEVSADRQDIRSGDNAAAHVVDGVARKPWSKLRESAVMVYDDTHRARRAGSPPRWTPRDDESRWQTTDAGYRFSASPRSADDLSDRNDWLDYRHYPTFAPAGSAASRLESPIVDHDAYNQSVSRRMNRVSDLGVSCRVTLGRGSRIAWQFVVDEDVHAIRVELSNTPRHVCIFSSTHSR
ncbi:MAG TPA: S26 family signal peptidase, partial [Pirellulaceae bacterium]|nr:S26 family signal peptidase [Pirellulaceae bacterium]